MSAAGQIDYDALAQQHGGSGALDYDALAAQHGGAAAQPSASIADHATAEISARKGGVREWLSDLESDLRYGQQGTVVGRALNKMGYQGAESLGGMEGSAGETIASPLLGPTHAAVGAADIASNRKWQGTKELVGGIAQTATLPASFMAPEEAELAAKGAGAVTDKIASAIPSLPSKQLARAGEMFQNVSKVAGQHTIQVTPELSDALMQYQQLVDAGGSRSLAVTKLLNRLTNPDKGPLTFEEARLFQSNISRLSADEAQRLTPVMKRQVGQIAAELNSTVEKTAAGAGKLEEFQAAMREYAQAKTNQARLAILKKYGLKAAAYAAGGGLAATGGKLAYDLLNQ